MILTKIIWIYHRYRLAKHRKGIKVKTYRNFGSLIIEFYCYLIQ